MPESHRKIKVISNKNSKLFRNKGNCLSMIDSFYQNPIANIIIKRKIAETISIKK